MALPCKRCPIRSRVLFATGGRGADVVYDADARDTFEMSLDMLATRGTLVLYGQSSGPVAHSTPGGCRASPARAVARVP
jgi:NADPH:quinone reductase-like Zn-dependent oxidoreductase